MDKTGELPEQFPMYGIFLLSLPARCDAFEELRARLAAAAAELRLPERETDQLLISADEVFSNIAAYAYPEGGGTVEVQLAKNADGTALYMIFSDHGIPFDPSAAAPPDTAAPPENRKVGGLGIHIVRHLMDGIVYRRTGDGRNLLTLTKKLSAPPEVHP